MLAQAVRRPAQQVRLAQLFRKFGLYQSFSKMKISALNLEIIFDSRGEQTLEAKIQSGGQIFKSSVPSGKSKGTHEAFVLEPKKAVEKFGEIRNEILGKDFKTQKEFDNFLISLDGTHSASSGQAPKRNLGGNLILALSLAFARLKAKENNLELFQYIRTICDKPACLPAERLVTSQFPHPIFNVINGGAHSGFAGTKSASLEFQEFQIIPEIDDFAIALSLGKEFYGKLQKILEEKFGKENISLGDEAGFSAPFKNNEEAIEILAELINKNNYPLSIGLDAAATNFFKDGFYEIDGKKYSAEELRGYYLNLVERYDILSVEDPFYEEAFGDFAELTKDLPSQSAAKEDKEKLIITDDLTTTNPQRLKIAIEKKSGNAILVKLNQIGTLSETLEVIRIAYKNNWKAVVSHRSGETMDDFIADLAVGVDAWGIKAGAPAKPERLAKYNRLLEIQNVNIKNQNDNLK